MRPWNRSVDVKSILDTLYPLLHWCHLYPRHLSLVTTPSYRLWKLMSHHVVWPYMVFSYSTSWTPHHFRPEVKTPRGDTCHTVAAAVPLLLVVQSLSQQPVPGAAVCAYRCPLPGHLCPSWEKQGNATFGDSSSATPSWYGQYKWNISDLYDVFHPAIIPKKFTITHWTAVIQIKKKGKFEV